MKHLKTTSLASILASLAMSSALAATTVYRLEVDDENHKTYIVGADNVSREVVLIAPEDYATLTNNVAETLRALNSTEDGRRSLHGAKTSTEVTDEARTTVYADGYRHSVKLQKKTQTPQTARLVPKAASVRPRGISSRLFELKQKVKAAKTAAPKTVTIEHDAATGTDKEAK